MKGSRLLVVEDDQLRTPLAALRITLEGALISNHQNAHDTLTAAIAELERLEATVRRPGPQPIFSLIRPAERQPDLVARPRSIEPDGTSSALQ